MKKLLLVMRNGVSELLTLLFEPEAIFNVLVALCIQVFVVYLNAYVFDNHRIARVCAMVAVVIDFLALYGAACQRARSSAPEQGEAGRCFGNCDYGPGLAGFCDVRERIRHRPKHRKLPT